MGLFGSDDDAGEVEVLGNPLQCVVCHHTRFVRRSAQLHTAGLTFLNLEWANRSAELFVCDRCGYIHWFLSE